MAAFDDLLTEIELARHDVMLALDTRHPARTPVIGWIVNDAFWYELLGDKRWADARFRITTVAGRERLTLAEFWIEHDPTIAQQEMRTVRELERQRAPR